jgi:hypothetical protein
MKLQPLRLYFQLDNENITKGEKKINSKYQKHKRASKITNDEIFSSDTCHSHW